MSVRRKLRTIIRNPYDNVFRVPYTTKNYKEVLHWWGHYTMGVMSKDVTLLNSIFSFRQKSKDHVLLYSSADIPTSVLLLGKIDGKYMNINIPYEGKINDSFVAVYT